jgi:dTDP-glucose 4,6-dehydratase
MPWVYILECADHSYYVGSTTNLDLRLKAHADGKGAAYTASRLPVKLVYSEEFQERRDAYAREKQVQGWGRAKREALIQGRYDLLPGLSKSHHSPPVEMRTGFTVETESVETGFRQARPTAPQPPVELVETGSAETRFTETGSRQARPTMFWHNTPVLVTGAGGFIASHLVETLVQQGARVRAFVRYNSRNDPGLLALLQPDVLQQVEIIAGDIRDLSAITAAMRGVSHVFHLGALIAIPYSYLHPAEVVETNVMGTLNVLLAGRELGVPRIIHTSTSEVYGTALRVPIDETHPLQGQSPYSASKIGADKIAESFYLSYNLPVVTVRPFNTYGPRQSARAVIPTIISQALTKDVIRLGNLEARRDLTYVADTVAGFLRAAETPGVEGETFNLGAGREVTIGELAHQIIALVGRPVTIELDAARLRPQKSEVQRLLSDNRKARHGIGWQPQISLEEGLHQTIAWVQANLHRFRPDQYTV